MPKVLTIGLEWCRSVARNFHFVEVVPAMDAPHPGNVALCNKSADDFRGKHRSKIFSSQGDRRSVLRPAQPYRNPAEIRVKVMDLDEQGDGLHVVGADRHVDGWCSPSIRAENASRGSPRIVDGAKPQFGMG